MFMMILEQHWHVYDDMTMSAFFHHVVLKTVFFFHSLPQSEPSITFAAHVVLVW